VIRRASILLVAASLLEGGAATIVAGRRPAPSASTPSDSADLMDVLSPTFVPNRGQLDPAARFSAEGGGISYFLTRSGLAMSLQDRGGTTQGWGIRMDFAGAERTQPRGLDRASGVVSYFSGAPEEWRVGLPTYDTVGYRDPWPGIDVRVGSEERGVKYSFLVRPGADPSDVALAWRGATDLRVDGAGRLHAATPAGEILDLAPIAYQVDRGRRVPVESAYVLDGHTVRFGIDGYDPRLPLLIDPTFRYAGFIGGDGNDAATGVAVDGSGNAYVVGWTTSPAATFPDTVGPDLTQNGNDDVFVAKVNPAGTGLVYAGYIGGAGDERANDVAVDSTGAAYVTGWTVSTQASFPVVGALDPTQNGDADAFVAKVGPSGASLVYSGYIGGDLSDHGNGIAIDGAGAAYVAGRASSAEATFPETVGPDLTQNMGDDAFVAKVNPAGSGLAYAGYVGGDQGDVGYDVAVDPAGNAYLVGDADSDELTFPNGNGMAGFTGPDTTQNGGTDAFVAKVNPGGTALTYAGYIGGTQFDFGRGAAVGSDGRLTVAGFTASDEASFPVKVGPDLTKNMNDDGYVARVNAAGSGLEYAGFIGGDGMDFGYDVAIDPTGAAYVTGYTNSSEATFPVAVGPDLTQAGANDAFIVKVAPAGAPIVYAGYVGGSGEDLGDAVAVDLGGNAYVAGDTSSTETTFPATVGPDATSNGNADGFVAKVETTEICKGRPVTRLGSEGNDRIVGTPGKDVVLALGGRDRVGTRSGADRVCAGGGNDKVRGGGGNDLLLGQAGRDALNGGAGKRDKCVGGPGKDTGKGCERGKV
jgi:beta-propeller repeat-containing protein/hemolysin type calcium-binding protein